MKKEDDDFDISFLDDEIKKFAAAAAKKQKDEQDRIEAEKKAREDRRKPSGGPGSSSSPRSETSKIPPVTFDDVIGMEEAKAEIMEAVVMPMKYGHIYERYNKRPVKGLLLYGSPGVGKTLIAKASAHAIATLSGKDVAEDSFAFYTSTDFQAKYKGETEAHIRRVFENALAFKQKNGYRQVVFIDEAEGTFSARGGANRMAHEDKDVTAMLGELDGTKELGAFVIMATNRPDALDAALTRPGRLDRKVHCKRPTFEDTVKLFDLYLGKTVASKKVSEKAAKEVFDPKYRFFTVVTEDGKKDFLLSHINSGAQVANFVDQAIGAAIVRDINSGKEGEVTFKELKDSIEKTFEQSRALNHKEDVADLAGYKQILDIIR